MASVWRSSASLPASLAGTGTVSLSVTVDGTVSNVLAVSFQ
ncbi:MAG: hypothetical protein ACLQVN_03890 [Bryobacteraceae bacterium]